MNIENNNAFEHNSDIRNLLRKFQISYNDLLPYLSNFSHTTRISEELAKDISEERKKEYLLAIQKIKEEKRKRYED